MNDEELKTIRNRDILERNAFARIIELAEDKNPFVPTVEERFEEILYIAKTECEMIQKRWYGTLPESEE